MSILKKSMGPPKYFFRVHLVGRFVPLVGVISRPEESPLQAVAPGLTVMLGFHVAIYVDKK